MSMIKVKTFIQALNLFSEDPAKSKKFLEDKRLTQAEKTILSCFFLLRDNELEKAKTELEKLTEINNNIVLSQKNLLQGLILNNQGRFSEAISLIKKSLELLPKNDLTYFKFIALHNLFTISYNQKNGAEMKKMLVQMKSLKVKTQKEIIRLMRCEFVYHSFTNNVKEAMEILEEIDLVKPQMAESDIIAQLINEFKFFIKLEDFKKCQSLLAEMKSYRKFNLTENYNFMKKLLTHYLDNKPLYFQDHEFSHHPTLFNQLKIIQQLEEGKSDEAKFYWDKLQKTSPEIYHRDFTYHGEKCLFSVCLEKYLKSTPAIILGIEGDDASNKSELIINILEKNKAPISRDYLFECLWGRPAADKEDYVRLSRKIYRVKQSHGLDIQYKKGCYLLIKNKDKKAA